jgi:hypothetical protein
MAINGNRAMIYAIEKSFKGKSMGLIPNTGYNSEEKAESMKNTLQEAADKRGSNVNYKVIKI